MDTSDIIEQLKSVSDSERKNFGKNMFPTEMEYLGVRTSEMRQLTKNWWTELKKLSPAELIQFTKGLVETRIFECNQIAYELLSMNKNALSLLSLNDLEALGKNIDNWATTDAFSVYISGWVWRNNQIADQDVLNWLDHGNLWWRRAAIVSTVGLNLKSRGGIGDAKRTLMVCEKVVADREDLIVKALSWALRELSKQDKPAVEKFMKKYDTILAGRVKREVNAKLITGKKTGNK